MGSYFTEKYEWVSSHEGIEHDLDRPTGTTVLWYRHVEGAPVDDVYDMGQGRDWADPFEVYVVSAQRIEGEERYPAEGAYSTDQLHLVIRLDEAESKLPGIEDPQINRYLKDRVVYDGVVFTVERVAAHGHFGIRESIIGVDLQEVDPDMLVNDPDFAQYSA